MARLNFSFIALLLVGATHSEGQPGPGNSHPTDDVCPDTIPTRGEYRNASYGFSFFIPAHHVGFWNSPTCVKESDEAGCMCMSDHGRIIPLGSKRPIHTRRIEVYAGYAVNVDEPSVDLGIAKRLAAIREKASPGTLDVRSRVKLKLAGMDAERIVVRYLNPKLKKWFVDEFVEGLRADIEYVIHMTSDDRFEGQDRVVFQQIVNSFSLSR